MSESGLYKELGILTKKKEQWEENIPYISSLLSYESVKIQAKTLWLHWTDLFRFADDEEAHVRLALSGRQKPSPQPLRIFMRIISCWETFWNYETEEQAIAALQKMNAAIDRGLSMIEM